MPGRDQLSQVDAARSRPAGDTPSLRESRIIVNHFLEWMPFGGASDGEIFVLFGVNRRRYQFLVRSALQAVGHEYRYETRARLVEAVAERPHRAA